MTELTPKQRSFLKRNWKSVLPRHLVIDILIAQGYTRKAALMEVSSLEQGSSTQGELHPCTNPSRLGSRRTLSLRS